MTVKYLNYSGTRFLTTTCKTSNCLIFYRILCQHFSSYYEIMATQHRWIIFTVTGIQITIELKSAHLPTTSTVMFSDEKCKFYIAGSTVVAPKIRHPDRSYFARLKKIYRNKIFVNYQFFQGLCVNQKSIHLFVLISIYSIIIKQVYGIFTAVTYAPLTEVTRMSE